MPRYNKMFELSVSDIELIETALRRAMEAPRQDHGADAPGVSAETQARIQALLGRLHNQKIFYRPRDSVYVGG